MITVHASLEDIPFLFQSLTGIEALSSLYTFHVDVLCETQPVDPKKRLGKTLTVASRQAPQVPLRYLSGIMMRVEVKGRNRNNRYDRYTLTVNPALRYLGLGRDYCVLQYPLRWPGPPIVTARVYNQGSMPSWDLSADETQMGLMTRSAGGTPDNGSFLVFEDAPGRETFDIHAERDLTVNIEGARTMRVKGIMC